jgi:hypothetical protein
MTLLTLALGACALSLTASARGDTSRSVRLFVAADVDVPAEVVRSAVERELGTAVVLTATRATAGTEQLDLEAKGEKLELRFRDRRGRTIERTVLAPTDPEARVRAIALHAGNLARNEADSLLKTVTAKPALDPVDPWVPGPSDSTSGPRSAALARATAEAARIPWHPRAPTPPPRTIVIETAPSNPQRNAGWLTVAFGSTGAALGAGAGLLARSIGSDASSGAVFAADAAIVSGLITMAVGAVLVLTARPTF